MYYGFSDINFWLYFLLFVPAIFISIYVPGRLYIAKLEIDNTLTKFVLSNALGIALWGFQGYIFGYLNLRFLSYVYCAASLLLFIIYFKSILREFSQLLEHIRRSAILPILLIIFGSVCQMLPIFGSGMKYKEGIKFFGNNSVDGVMHLAYIRSIVNHFPPREPGFSGLLIHNYHYWTDLVEADLSRVWSLPIIHLFFQFLPVYLAILTGLMGYVLVKEWGGNRKMALWFVFLLYFASDAAYLVLIVLGKHFGFYTPAIDSGIIQFLNMPHVFGKVIFLAGLIVFNRWLKLRNFKWAVLSVLFYASLFGFKIYFGLFIGIGLVSYYIGKICYEAYKLKKLSFDLSFLVMLASFSLVSVAIFLPHNYGAGGFVFVYLEWPRSLLGAGSIDWQQWWLRRQVYEAAHNVRNLFVLDVVAVIIAFVSIYGTRLLGFVVSKKLLRSLGYEKILLLIPPLIIFHLLGLFTIQVSGGVNVYNFFSVSAVVLSFFAAFQLSRINRGPLGIVVIALFITFTIPRSIYEVTNNFNKYSSKDYHLISSDELSAFKYIKEHTKANDLVQASPANHLDDETPYVTFFTSRESFLSGIGLLSTHNVKLEDRQRRLASIFNADTLIDFRAKLKQYHISYIYLEKNPEEALKFKLDPTYISTVFENKSTFVLQVH